MNRSLAGSIVFGTVVLSALLFSFLSCGTSSTQLFSDSGSGSDSDVSDEVDSETSPDSDSRDEHDSEPTDSDEIEEDTDPIDSDVDEVVVDFTDTCETCIDDESCEESSRCVLLAGENLCMPECDRDAPLCPRGFECVIPGDIDTEVCFPEDGETCCLDEDGDRYGDGPGCRGSDCDDADENIHPYAFEYCNGINDDCDGAIDEDPIDCGGCEHTEGDCHPDCGVECVESECRPTEAINCGWFGIVCGMDSCPVGCIEDSHCADGAHCTGGDCRWDLTQGNLCERDRECEDRRCVDNRCCDSICDGPCESCTNADGECRAVPAGTDPDGECGGFRCSMYFSGFESGDTCYQHDDVDDDEAVCNGARECAPADILCPLQPLGDVIINCDDTCQEPAPSTCVFGIPGRCESLDAVAGTHTCGLGICENTVDRCRGSRPNPCDPLPVARVETCNSLDDDCDGIDDDGDPDDLCGGHPTIALSTCEEGVCGIAECIPGRFDLDGIYENGCESKHP